MAEQPPDEPERQRAELYARLAGTSRTMPHHHRRHILGLREIPQPLAGLQPHDQRQQMLLILRLGPRPLHLGIRRGKRLSQLPPGHHPAKPRIRGLIDRGHTQPPQTSPRRRRPP